MAIQVKNLPLIVLIRVTANLPKWNIDVDAAAGLHGSERWLERRGVCWGIHKMFEPTCNTTPRTEKRGTVVLSPRYLSCPLSACPRLYTAANSAYKMRWCFPKCDLNATPFLKVLAAENFICDARLDHRGHWCDMRGRNGWHRREREKEGDRRGGGGGQREGEEERRNEARLQGWTQNVSLPPFFSISPPHEISFGL